MPLHTIGYNTTRRQMSAPEKNQRTTLHTLKLLKDLVGGHNVTHHHHTIWSWCLTKQCLLHASQMQQNGPCQVSIKWLGNKGWVTNETWIEVEWKHYEGNWKEKSKGWIKYMFAFIVRHWGCAQTMLRIFCDFLMPLCNYSLWFFVFDVYANVLVVAWIDIFWSWMITDHRK